MLSLLFGAALAAAAPAEAAVDDPSRPDARVTHGPSCRPGGLVVEVVAGTDPYSVRLATTRTPSGEDQAALQPGQTVVLRTGDVAWGETIDGRLEYTAADGSAFVDELEEYSFTRPTREDCAAVSAPTTPHPTPTTTSPAPGTTTAPVPPSTSAPSTSGPVPTPEATTSAPAGSPGSSGDGDGAQQVTAGGTVTLRASGFLPGERVTIQLADAVLGSAVADADGSVQAQVRIPDGTEAGRATVALVGDDSAVVADVELRVAAAETAVGSGADDLVPLTVAAVALVATVGALVSEANRQRAGNQPLRRA
jgi:hypothetical protein